MMLYAWSTTYFILFLSSLELQEASSPRELSSTLRGPSPDPLSFICVFFRQQDLNLWLLDCESSALTTWLQPTRYKATLLGNLEIKNIEIMNSLDKTKLKALM